MEKAKFKLDGYFFEKATLDFSNKGGNLNLSFHPRGVYRKETQTYTLQLGFIAEGEQNNVVSVDCIAEFSFVDCEGMNEIPEYFYTNSIAILFPYIRAFVSTLSLQANVLPIILPTLNLTKLGEVLKIHTIVEN